MLFISSYHFFNKSILGCLVVNSVFKTGVEFKNSVYQNAIGHFIFKNFCLTSLFPSRKANLLAVIADRLLEFPVPAVLLRL